MKMIEFNEVKNFFEKETLAYENVYRRVSSNHPLELMIGTDNAYRPSLLLVTKNKPEKVPDSSMISIVVGLRKDNLYTLRFTLLGDKYLDLFCYFCVDMINSSNHCTKEDDSSFLCNRYLLWKKMLAKTRNSLLGDNEIKGLIGELYFLKEYLMKEYDVKDVLKAWTGPQGVDQDFIFSDTWYEVKTTSPGSTSVKISSVEQLDTNNVGTLAVLFLDKTSSIDKERLNLNKLVIDIRKSMNDEMSESYFDSILLASGYVNNMEYDNYNYHFKKMNLYKIDDKFPCLRQKNLTSAIGKVNYELLLNDIEKWGISNGITGI